MPEKAFNFYRGFLFVFFEKNFVNFGFFDSANKDSVFENNKVLSNHILLTFKLYIYKSREKKSHKYKQSHS